jgi:hypothetical protein
MVVGLVVAGGSVLLAPAAASAAGSTYSGAIYQITFSINCNNPSASCAQGGLGGQWGWIALMPFAAGAQDGAANAQITECGHQIGGGGPGTAGAGHLSADGTWTDTSTPGAITPTDPHGDYLSITVGGITLIVPATYGHYTVNAFGLTGQIQVSP